MRSSLARAAVTAAACAASLAACSSGGARPSPPPVDGGGITLWMAPNGSEVVLKLDTVQPTVPF